ncbi:hypothetical protein OLEAN_C15550 [Oleispira antarctica RB-8]|uniref:Uncharacterized protein n=1 Tax=Oleispira antarctica RB-8 TaxID=698738 RepID=R4YLN7_OLEAN|nr:hypothetical protein OLEAN_C15550 [Oleispira antarctica RB-8]
MFEGADTLAAQEHFGEAKKTWYKSDFDTEMQLVKFKGAELSLEHESKLISLVDAYLINQSLDPISYPTAGAGYNSNSWAPSLIQHAGGKVKENMKGLDIKKGYGQSLLIFVLGLLSLVVADYSMRQFTGSPNNLGMPEVVWFALQVIISVVLIFVFIKNIQTLPISKKIISSLLLLLIGAVMYICIIYGYVFSTQIDGF